MPYQHLPHYQPCHSHQHANVPRYCTVSPWDTPTPTPTTDKHCRVPIMLPQTHNCAYRTVEVIWQQNCKLAVVCIYLHIHTVMNTAILQLVAIYRMSQEECARLRESVPYVKVYRYSPKHLYAKLNGYGDNGQRKVWSSCGSTYCTCPADALLVQLCSRLIPKCVVSKVISVLQYCWVFMCHVKCLEPWGQLRH
jgi:hypothetical protein